MKKEENWAGGKDVEEGSWGERGTVHFSDCLAKITDDFVSIKRKDWGRRGFPAFILKGIDGKVETGEESSIGCRERKNGKFTSMGPWKKKILG